MAWKTINGRRFQVPDQQTVPETSITYDSTPKPEGTGVQPETSTMTATANERGEAEFDRTQPSNTEYNPYQALRDKAPGSEPVSPYVGTGQEEPTEEVAPVTPAPEVQGATATGVSDMTYKEQAEADLTPGFEQWEQDNGKLFDLAEELKDEKITSYEELYDRQIARLEEIQSIMTELNAQKNKLIEGSAEVQRAEIEAAYQANAEALRIAQERLDNTQRKVLAEREKQLERKKINEANMLAVIGGFGSMAGNKMMIDSIDEAEDKMAWLKTEFSLQDQEMSGKVVKLNNDYKNDKLKLEQWKQESLQRNYENLQNFIVDIIENEDMADQQKVEAINRAKDQYNATVSNINQSVIDTRFELSREIIQRTDQLRQEAEAKSIKEGEMARKEIEFARSDLALLSENYAFEDFASLPSEVKTKIDELEKASGFPPGFTEQAIKNFQSQHEGQDYQIRFEKDANGNLVVVGVDKNTGLVAATSTVELGKTTSITPQNDMEKSFGVGEVGGWCGDFASRVSTASQVGDTWAEKISKVTHRDNPTAGDKLVIPLGVTDSGKDYGHVAVVLGYNPENGEIQVVESNKDGRQNRGEGQGVITMGTYNLNKLKEVYGNNFGFIEGQLKGDYAKYAEKYGLTGGGDEYAGMFEGEQETAPVKTETPTEEEVDYESEFEDF